MNLNLTEDKETQEQVLLRLRKQIMNVCKSTVVLNLKNSFPVVQNWIKDNLTDTNICDLALLYKKTLDGFVEEKKLIVHPSLWEEFQSLCEKRSNKKCKVHMEKVMDLGQKFNQNIQKAFDVAGYFPDEAELEIFGANEIKNVTTSLEATFVFPTTKLLSEKLMKIYKEKNKSIIAVHMLKSKKIADSIKRIYLKEMETYMKNNSMSQTELQRLHSGLQAEAVRVFDNNFGDNVFGNMIRIHESCKAELREDLKKEFRLYQVKHSEKLSSWVTQQEISLQKLVAECTSDIQEFGESTERKFTRGTLNEIYRITEKFKEGMDLWNELMLKVETPSSECMKIDWLALEEEFDNVWIEFVFGKQITYAARGEIIYKEFLNIHQTKMLDAAKTNDREHITALHKNLVAECVTDFENIVPYCQDQYNKEQLESQLNGIFNITIASRDYYLQYKEKMEDVLRNNNNVMVWITFLGYHTKIKNELTKLLEIEGSKKLGDMSQHYLPRHISHLENCMEEQFRRFTYCQITIHRLHHYFIYKN